MAVPSAMVGRGSAGSRSRKARAMGAQFAGWAAKIRGSRSICRADSNSEKPMPQPSTLEPAPQGTTTLSGAEKPRSSQSS